VLVGLQLAGVVVAQPATTNPVGGGGRGGGAPNYPVPYRVPTTQSISEIMDRVLKYVDANTPARLVHRDTNEPITDYSKPSPDAILERGSFQLLSYEWGVNYSGMIAASAATGDPRYADFVARRFKFISEAAPMFRAQATTLPSFGPGAATQPLPDIGAATGARDGRGGFGGFGGRGGRGGGAFTFRSIFNPGSLDDSGSICAAMIKARRAGVGPDMMPYIQTLINWVANKQYRFSDGTLARMRPLPETLWLDDLYMSVPALSQMGKLTGERKYYDDACKQILQFSQRMFVKEKGLWMHGWTNSTDEHPAFHWARANGWAIMAMAELLDVLPEDHPQRAAIIDLFRQHVRGLAKLQSSTGLWHQLLDRDDSYLETSASAMYVYGIARGVERGWISPVTYGPIAYLGWAGVTTKVNAEGGVEGTCVGTGMGWDPAFYYYRPTSVLAAHGYGPVMLAGAELIQLSKKETFQANDGAIMRVMPRQ
jgi:rhamnogalacturonyl hydrolase YesR